jgi:hypothetical protein
MRFSLALPGGLFVSVSLIVGRHQAGHPRSVMGAEDEAGRAVMGRPREFEFEAITQPRRIVGISLAQEAFPAPAVESVDASRGVAAVEVASANGQGERAECVEIAPAVGRHADPGLVIRRHERQRIDELGLVRLVGDAELEDAVDSGGVLEIVDLGAGQGFLNGASVIWSCVGGSRVSKKQS